MATTLRHRRRVRARPRPIRRCSSRSVTSASRRSARSFADLDARLIIEDERSVAARPVSWSSRSRSASRPSSVSTSSAAVTSLQPTHIHESASGRRGSSSLMTETLSMARRARDPRRRTPVCSATGTFTPPTEDPVRRHPARLRARSRRSTEGAGAWTGRCLLPAGGDALGWDVEITANLELTKSPLMRLLAISGSLRRRSYNSALLDAAAAECGPEIDFVFWNRLDRIPAYNEDSEIQPEAVGLLKQRDSASRRGPRRDSRVQRLDPRRAQERPRLGLATLRRQPAPRQAGRGDRRQPGSLRRRLGAGRAPQDPADDRSIRRGGASWPSPTPSMPSPPMDASAIREPASGAAVRSSRLLRAQIGRRAA